MLCIATPSSVGPVDDQTIYLPLDVEISAHLHPGLYHALRQALCTMD
jgi:hypothetical protein